MTQHKRLCSRMAHKLRKIFTWRWFYLDFAKITSFPSLPVVFRPRRYFESPDLTKKRVKGRAIVISNHTSFWDPLIITWEFFTRRLRFLVSQRIFELSRAFAWILKKSGCIVVDKDQFEFSCVTEMMDTLKGDGIVCIFPEGTISANKDIMPFKEGVVLLALKTGAPIYPLYIISDETLKRPKVVMHGKPIWLREHCAHNIPGMREVQALSQMLHDKMVELKDMTERLEAERLRRKHRAKVHENTLDTEAAR